jgi:hypothetical protein
MSHKYKIMANYITMFNIFIDRSIVSTVISLLFQLTSSYQLSNNYTPKHQPNSLRLDDMSKSKSKSKSKSHYDRLTVGQSVLVSGAHLGPATNITFSLKFSSDSCVFVIL